MDDCRFKSCRNFNHKNSPLLLQGAVFMVEMTGLEPAASASRTQRSTKLSHISIAYDFLTLKYYNIYRR